MIERTNTPIATTLSAADALEQSDLTRDHCAVVGLQFGDEGKGQIVDLLASKFDLVVRYNGGANAGHSVTLGDQRFALHLIPSGILSSHVTNVVANGVVVDPAAILEEIEQLTQRGVNIGDNLRISNRAHLVFPYHKVHDRLMDRALVVSRGEAAMIGTTGRGIGPCYADKALRSTAIRVGELLDPPRFQEKLKHVVTIKNLILEALARACDEPFEPCNAQELGDTYLRYAQSLMPHICDTTTLLHEAVQAGKHLLFEGANATLLDIDHGTYPFVTSSNCSSLGIYTGTGLPGRTIRQVIGVVKLYTSRVGGGPFITELHDDMAHHLREVGREYGTTTGRPRRCGWLDLVAVKYAATISGAKTLACTGLSVLSNLPEIKVCVGYRHNGCELTSFPADAEVLAHVEPIYETLPGFTGPVDQCTTYGELPAEADAYIQRIEEYVGATIRIACVGPRRDQILVRP